MGKESTAGKRAPAQLDSGHHYDLAGSWELEPSERGDLFHRIRAFPAEVRDWREELVERIQESLPSASGAEGRERTRALLDEGIVRLRETRRILGIIYPETAPVERAPGIDADARRALGRLDPYREIVSASPEAKEALKPSFSLPPNIRLELEALLSALGKDVCRPTPRCDGCELQKTCGFFRRKAARQARIDVPTVIDLFAGAGGLSEGFRRAGFDCAAASDLDEVAMKTFRFNHPEMPDEAVIARDVRDLKASELRRLLNGRRLDVLAGAPPCQGFSSAGFRSKKTRTGYRAAKDERNFLFEHLVGLALDLKPPLFLMENVPGMETARKEDLSFLDAAAQMLERGGYKTATWKLCASAYGVPQERVRCFLVGARGVALPAPPPEEYQNIRKRDYDPDALPRVSFNEATFDLPAREAGTGSGCDPWDRSPVADDFRFRRYLGKFKLRGGSRLIWNHYARYHNETDLELYALLKPGEDSVHAIERHGRSDLMKYRRDVFDDKYARLYADRPSKTIVAHLAKDGNGYIHPTQTRDISIREAARLQSFPDSYVFCGSPSDQWVQIGNAVPPILAEAVASCFRRIIERKCE
jgi:DNA (cytosine-5)-methyltransferase 1